MTLVFVMALSITAASILSLSLNSHKITMRNQLRADARAVAESELEYILYQFKAEVVRGKAASDAPSLLAAIAEVIPMDATTIPDTSTQLVRTPFLQLHRDAGWTVKRSTQLLITMNGKIPDGTSKIGTFTYIIARVEVIPPPSSPFANIETVRVGRRFINSNATIFQYSMFFQGDLELNPGSNTTIIGDVVSSGNVYMAPVSGNQLKIMGNVLYVKGNNFNSDGTTTVLWNPEAPPVGTPFVAPTFATSQASQLKELDAPENLLGGIDPAATARARPDLFGPPGRTDPNTWTDAELAAAENNVYRSLIVPPPAASTASEYPNGATADDDVVAVRRAYNRAGLVVTVATNGSITATKVVNGVATDVTSVIKANAMTNFAPIVNGVPGPPTYTTAVYDEREGKTVQTTEINVGNLMSAIATNPSLADFNGLLYVNVTGSSASTPGAVRLVNGSDLSANPSGFSVATNAGIYVKGSYNTTEIPADGGATRPVPSMLMGDAITVLSDAWTDSTVSRPLAQRIATAGSTEVNAGLLTGNRASTLSKSSGGAQNLVRYEENWQNQGVVFNGSLGRLFQSAHYVAPYGGVGSVYEVPNRTFAFDTNLQNNRPPGSPETTAFSRGSFFVW